MDASLQISFLQDFKDDYLRNNKANGSKNIRCFPCCCEGGHSQKGFCGQPVHAELVITGGHVNVDNLLIVGELQPQDEDFSPLASGALQSAVLGRAYHALPTCTLAKKEALSSEVVDLRFESKPWHYDWKGSRQKQHTLHTFVASVLLPSAEDPAVLVLLAQACSPAFRISCVRRCNSKGPVLTTEEVFLEPYQGGGGGGGQLLPVPAHAQLLSAEEEGAIVLPRSTKRRRLPAPPRGCKKPKQQHVVAEAVPIEEEEEEEEEEHEEVHVLQQAARLTVLLQAMRQQLLLQQQQTQQQQQTPMTMPRLVTPEQHTSSSSSSEEVRGAPAFCRTSYGVLKAEDNSSDSFSEEVPCSSSLFQQAVQLPHRRGSALQQALHGVVFSS